MKYVDLIAEALLYLLLGAVVASVTYAALGLLTGCDATLEHELSITLEDECLFCFPECVGSTYYCTDTKGTHCGDCKVACAAASGILCGDEGPECFQRIGEDRGEVYVPVVCIADE